MNLTVVCVYSGKTTVGKLVAQALQYPFLDVDTLTEQSTQMKIAEIFANEGEESFRDLETATLKVGMHQTGIARPSLHPRYRP